MNKVKIETAQAPAAIGPYSQAIRAGNCIFVSGQLPVDAETGELIAEVAAATQKSLSNIAAILAAAGCTMNQVVKTTVFLSDLNDFQAMNQAYSGFFTANAPARSTIEVAGLPKGAVVEIEAIAVVD